MSWLILASMIQSSIITFRYFCLPTVIRLIGVA